MNMTTNFSVLSQLLGSYFHQDWSDEFGSDGEALQAIVQAEPREQVEIGVEEIDQLLAEHKSEEELRVIMVDEIGCYFEPESQGIGYMDWLARVRGYFAES
jgi:hypothetical protein